VFIVVIYVYTDKYKIKKQSYWCIWYTKDINKVQTLLFNYKLDKTRYYLINCYILTKKNRVVAKELCRGNSCFILLTSRISFNNFVRLITCIIYLFNSFLRAVREFIDVLCHCFQFAALYTDVNFI